VSLLLIYDPLMPPKTPYADDLGDREPVGSIRENLSRLRAIASWSPQQFARSYAPGKWSAREILIHLAHAELAFGNRARMALAAPGRDYVAQPFNQDSWMARESLLGGREALEALLAVGAINSALYASLSPADREIQFSHPEYGLLTIDWLIHQSAGHLVHHVRQIDTIDHR
jgi:DinB family protein